MFDINLIRENPEKVKAGLAARNFDTKLIEKLIRFDEEWRQKNAALDELKAEQNNLNRELGRRKAEDGLARAKILKQRIADIQKDAEVAKKKRDEILGNLPNLPLEGAPVGKDALANRILREVGKKPKFAFPQKDYLTIAENLGIIDVKKAAEVSGTRFGYILKDAALLEFALVQLAFETLLKRGFTPIVPPVMLRPKVFEGMGRLSEDQKEERYFLPKDELYLAGSAEHTIGPFHMNEVFEEKDLPKRYIGFSTCFRREAGSYGKDTRGILRVHQFDKVEMFSFVKPENSEKEQELLLKLQEDLMWALKLPYRVVLISTGDMGFADAKQYDIETWLPSAEEYRETHSCSNTTDFQARGIDVKWRDKNGKKEFVHMLNGTAFAIGRMIIAIIENYQTKKGTVVVPRVLKKYLGKNEIQ